MNALLVIDIQYDFLPGGALPVPQGDEIIPIINRLQPKFDLVIATQDWHPRGHKSFASSHPGKKSFEEIEWMGRRQVLWPDHCIQGSPGAAFSNNLDLNRVEAIFRKGISPEIDSYSGFFDNGHLKSTGLAAYLKGKGITSVYVAGLAADYCVYFTAKDALASGFNTFVIEDATRAINPDNFQHIKADIIKNNGSIIQATNLLL
jgi:nicotinamidase/pyrazinamidase